MIDRRAIVKARSRIRVAASALDALVRCDKCSTFTDAWYTYLVACKGVYTALEQGSKDCPQDRQWFGKKKAERKADDLLQYIVQSRDDDEHGLAAPVGYRPASFTFGENDGGSSYEVIEGKDGVSHVKMNIVSKDGKSLVHVKGQIPMMVLKPVTGRGPVTYHPPKTHLGNPCDGLLPHEAGELNLAYLTALVDEAEALA